MVDFETEVYYAEQGGCQIYHSPFPRLQKASQATADASRENCRLSRFLSHPMLELVIVIVGGAMKCLKEGMGHEG